jgi:hypothetical protein
VLNMALHSFKQGSANRYTNLPRRHLHSGFRSRITPSHLSVCCQRFVSCQALALNERSYSDEDDFPSEIPSKFELLQRFERPKPLVKVRLNVHYRVHSRQMLCVGGSNIPFGWSFLSISKVPMTWNHGDVWSCEMELPAGQKLEYKYVILEEQVIRHVDAGIPCLFRRWNPHQTCSYCETFEYEWSSYFLIWAATKNLVGKRTCWVL